MFPTGWDSHTFWDKGTEVHSLSRDKGTRGQDQNLAKRLDGPGQPVKIQNRTWDGTVQDFDSLLHPVPRVKTGLSRKGHYKTGKRHSKNRKGCSKPGKDSEK